MINARGGRIEYSYDTLNRVATKTLYDASETIEDQVIYSYDDAGRLLTVDNNSADITMGYDKAHRLTSVTTGGAMPAFTINYDYFKNDKRKKMLDTVGDTNYSLRTQLSPVKTITTPNMGTFTITYDNLMRRDDMTLGNGIVANYEYDDALQLTLLEYKDGATPVTSHQYPLYDDVGNRKQEIDINGTHNFDYDELYRLTSATHPTGNPNESFAYTDPVGSVGNRTSSHLSSSYTYDELNRLQQDDEYTYGYDADGNQILKTLKSDLSYTVYEYNAENKLVKVEQYDEFSTLISTSAYEYDGFDRRVKKNVEGVVTYYIYDQEDIRFETDELGNILAEYIHGSGIDEPLSMRRNGQNYYYHLNGLGTVIALTDSSKTKVQEYIYDSFGQIISQTGSITNPYTYAGREYVGESGLYYYRARHYDAGIGRFISEDPIGIDGGINLYVYAINNPVNYVDSNGCNVVGSIIWICKKIIGSIFGDMFGKVLKPGPGPDDKERDDDGDGTPNMGDSDSEHCMFECNKEEEEEEKDDSGVPNSRVKCK